MSKDDDSGYKFWSRVDMVRGTQSLIDFGKQAGINYASLKSMRSRCQMPKLASVVAISEALDVTIDYLLKGVDEGEVSKEMAFVRDNEAARLLIRRVMDNPALLEALAAVAALADRPEVTSSKQA